jgi:hypothetical protein
MRSESQRMLLACIAADAAQPRPEAPREQRRRTRRAKPQKPATARPIDMTEAKGRQVPPQADTSAESAFEVPYVQGGPTVQRTGYWPAVPLGQDIPPVSVDWVSVQRALLSGKAWIVGR